MPRDLSLLTYPDTPSAEDSNSVARIWNRSDLDRASSVLNYEQMWPVIRRLEAGLPITVVAFGDSITKDNGGCFHRDRCAEAVDGRAGRQAGRQAAGRQAALRGAERSSTAHRIIWVSAQRSALQ